MKHFWLYTAMYSIKLHTKWSLYLTTYAIQIQQKRITQQLELILVLNQKDSI